MKDPVPLQAPCAHALPLLPFAAQSTCPQPEDEKLIAAKAPLGGQPERRQAGRALAAQPIFNS